MEYLGNKEILKLNKTGFLCSQKCPAEIVLKSHDWAKKQRENGNCIVCGNHSQIEKDVFEILLKGKQPLILVIPRKMKKRWETEIIKALEQKRLLIISPFGSETNRITKETAWVKNKTIIDLSERMVIGYKTESGQLDELLKGKKYESL